MSKLFDPKITNKGTELPLIDLKGKPYLQVAYRLVWFREDHPKGNIQTALLQVNEKEAVVKAVICDADGKILSSGHKKEYADNFGDFIEKAETGAIGRALAVAGYGTQFEPELDEGGRIADSPIMIPNKSREFVGEQEKNTTDSKENSTNKSSGTNGSVRNIKPAVTGNTKTFDTKALRSLIKTAAEVLNSQEKLDFAGFIDEFLKPHKATKVDALKDSEVLVVAQAVGKKYPELQLLQ